MHCQDNYLLIVIVFWKTDLNITNTEIHLLPVHVNYTPALSRDNKHLTIEMILMLSVIVLFTYPEFISTK